MQKRGANLIIVYNNKTCEEFLAKEYGYKVRLNSKQLKLSLYTRFLLKDIEIFLKYLIIQYSITKPKFLI